MWYVIHLWRVEYNIHVTVRYGSEYVRHSITSTHTAQSTTHKTSTVYFVFCIYQPCCDRWISDNRGRVVKYRRRHLHLSTISWCPRWEESSFLSEPQSGQFFSSSLFSNSRMHHSLVNIEQRSLVKKLKLTSFLLRIYSTPTTMITMDSLI